MYDRLIVASGLTDLEGAIELALNDSSERSRLIEAERIIRGYMKARGIDFEGRALPMSMRPLLMDEAQVVDTASRLRLVRTAINRVIAAVRDDIRAGTDTVLTRFFGGVSDTV